MSEASNQVVIVAQAGIHLDPRGHGPKGELRMQLVVTTR
jgi:hypothetical protein